MMMGWIQHPDLSSDELGRLSKSQAVERFADHDWGTELTWLQALKVGSREWCQPGMGLVDPSDRILRLCPMSEDRLAIHYYYPASKGLGRWVGSRTTRSVMDAPLALAEELIRGFYKGVHERFLAQVRDAQPRRGLPVHPSSASHV